jgi:hypothetical protein
MSSDQPKTEPKKDIHRIFVEERHLIDEALKQGVREAMIRHKKDGLPVVIYNRSSPRPCSGRL